MNLTLGFLLAGFLSLAFAFGAEFLKQPNRRGGTFSGEPHLGGQQAVAMEGVIDHGSELESFTSLPLLATVYISRQPRS